MESRTLVTLRYMGQPMRGLDRELFKDLHRRPLWNTQKLVGLNAQSPSWMIEAVPQCEFRIC